jgi:hypothetical protein
MRDWWKELTQGLNELGYVDGSNIEFVWTFADGKFERLPAVVPENLIRPDSRDEAESAHHPMRCLRSSIYFGRLWPTRSSRSGGLNSRIFFFGINSTLH